MTSENSSRSASFFPNICDQLRRKRYHPCKLGKQQLSTLPRDSNREGSEELRHHPTPAPAAAAAFTPVIGPALQSLDEGRISSGMRQTLDGSFSAVSKQHYASKYAMHSFAKLCNLMFLLKCAFVSKLVTFPKFVIFTSNVSENYFGNFVANSGNFGEKSAFRAMQRSALGRSRRELSNEYLLFTCKMWLRYSRERAL